MHGIQLEWRSDRAYDQRVANLRGTGPRLNGDMFLKASGADATVFDDGAKDRLMGGSGRGDWFIANRHGGTTDKIYGLTSNEWIDELS